MYVPGTRAEVRARKATRYVPRQEIRNRKKHHTYTYKKRTFPSTLSEKRKRKREKRGEQPLQWYERIETKNDAATANAY